MDRGRTYELGRDFPEMSVTENSASLKCLQILSKDFLGKNLIVLKLYTAWWLNAQYEGRG